MSIRQIFYSLAVAVLIGWLLVIGKTVILPFLVAVMLTYVLVGATRGLRRLPVLILLPPWLHYVIALAIFALALVTIVLVAVSNLRSIAQTPLAHEEDMLLLLGQVMDLLNLDETPTWENLRRMLLQHLDLPRLSLALLSTLASVGGYTVLILTYMAFMVAERGPLQRKMQRMMPDSGDRSATLAMFGQINAQVVTYLTAKTMINVILGVLSWGLMWLMGVENAVFWAFLIAIFNYIPYVGSFAGVAVVVLYVAFAYGDLGLIALSLALLTAAQVYVGNILEPRIFARTLNLSPLTVLLALVVWSAIWGLAGAILAVPLTSIVTIVLAAFPSTRPIAVLASRDGEILE